MMILVVINIDDDNAQTHQGWYIDQEVVDNIQVMLGEPNMNALIPAETYAARLELSKDVIYLETHGA